MIKASLREKGLNFNQNNSKMFNVYAGDSPRKYTSSDPADI